MIGIVGGTGAVGTAVARALRSSVRSGSRASGVDAMDGASLHHFCDGCRVVIDCTGPSSPELVEQIARTAFEHGAAYVTPAGGGFVFDAAARAHAAHPQRVALVAAGMMPGLTALLPRALAPASRLTAYVGGRGLFTRSAAIDFLAARRGTTALAPLVDVELRFFPRPVTAFPHVSEESERVARAMDLAESRWYTVFDGAHTIAALHDPERLARASALDLFGRAPYQRMVFIADDARSLVVHARDASELTGAFAAIAASSLDAIAPGVHYAGEVLDANTALAALRSSFAVTAVETLHAVFEEGML